MSFAVLADIGIIASGAKYAAAIIPFFAIALYLLQKYYLRTSRQMRYLDLEAKAPLYTQFSEMTAGLQHIRAFGWQSDTLTHSLKLLDYSQRPYYYLYCIQRWLTLVLDMCVLVIATTLITCTQLHRRNFAERGWFSARKPRHVRRDAYPVDRFWG